MQQATGPTASLQQPQQPSAAAAPLVKQPQSHAAGGPCPPQPASAVAEIAAAAAVPESTAVVGAVDNRSTTAQPAAMEAKAQVNNNIISVIDVTTMY